MVSVRFNGAASKQSAPGEQVTITVTKPDSTKETLTASTDAAGAYSVTKAYTVGGAYKAQPSIPADAEYIAVTGAEVPFVIGLADRTLTLTVTLI